MVTDLRRDVDRCEERLTRELAALPGPLELREVELVPEGETMDAGSRPSALLRDERGRRYFFKAAEVAHVAAEELSYRVRTLGGRPAIPTAARRLELPRVGLADGMLQPFVEHARARLASDPLAWTPLQREVMLREHPWEWLLANLDTHVDQYVLIGPSQYPLDVDWDHALLDLDVTELTRFTRRNVAIAPIRNLLYDAYANGRVRLDFWGLRRELSRASQLDSGELGRIVDRYGVAVGLDAADRRGLAKRVVARKKALRRTFDKLLASMRLERLQLVRGRVAPLERAFTVLQDEWQRLLVRVLHDRVVRRALKLHKEILALRQRHRGAM